MVQSRKSPVHPLAAKFSDVHPSLADWVVLLKTKTGEFVIENVGQFMTGFHPDSTRSTPALRARFRPAHTHGFFGRLDCMYTPENVGLLPIDMLDEYEEGQPPTDEFISEYFDNGAVRDPRDPRFVWDGSFIVKLQKVHKVFGCTPKVFREVYLAKFCEDMAVEADCIRQAEENAQLGW